MYISRYISSATFAWSSKLTVDIDSMGPGLQLFGGQFSNFLLGKVPLEFKLHGMSIFDDIQMATYFGTEWCYSDMYCVCWYDLDPIQGQGQGYGAFELPTTSEAVHAGGDDRSPLAGLSGYSRSWCQLSDYVILWRGIKLQRMPDFHNNIRFFWHIVTT